MAKVNKTRYALLGVLSLMSGSGYDIKKFCDYSIGHFWNENYGHIYPVLKKMEEEFLITKKVEQTEGRPSKNIYSITEKGREELEKWITLPVEQEPIRSELLLKIFLSKDIPVKNVIEKIQKLKEDSEENLKKYSEVENLIKGKNDIDKKNLILWLSTINFGKHDEEAKIKWCEETLNALEEIKDL
ncbi:PadR family transcriptional regulator [Clostridium weizhouense]|uniref:PadR family transcriptional regulator n=1 Tax=Clostridium weizhouense TaxID=2859781 RepID=A0ABS7APX9_9CLOT|nr:PadR family transcriptional regulator [Clostridium weizhouense]MBW6410720.1 PadR family transcriptional regulator [Clostridium weizhouense]